MTSEHKSIIKFYFSNYNVNKRRIEQLREQVVNAKLTPNYSPKTGKRVKGQNNGEEQLVDALNTIDELEKWCKVYEKTKDTYFFDNIKRRFIEWKFERGKSVTQIVNGVYICEDTYFRWLDEILTLADNWAKDKEIEAYNNTEEYERYQKRGRC